jgi:P-type Cu2+ transporter
MESSYMDHNHSKDTVEKQDDHKHVEHSHHDHHSHMITDFKKRFWVSLIITIPVLLLSPLIQEFLNVRDAFHFIGDMYLLFVFSTFIFFYGGWPFLKGLFSELKKKQPGMMTLIALAISVAYF